MELKFSKTSRFFAPVERALGTPSRTVRWPLRVDLGPGGYDRDVQIVLRLNNSASFTSDWTGKVLPDSQLGSALPPRCCNASGTTGASGSRISTDR